jgi:hypothetical protein
MDFNTIKYELQNIFCENGKVMYEKPIQIAADFLRKSTETSAVAQRNEPNKTEETKKLIAYINVNHLWNCDINFNLFLSEGAEQRAYIKDKSKVLKLNDATC